MLEDLKTLLDIEDSNLDAKLKLILANTTARLKLILGIDPPEEMNHIILEVAVIRFNRIGSEGMSSHTVEGESTSYSDSDFNAFSGEIQAFLDAQKNGTRGKVRFL
jgi:hypothetical protein